MSITDLITSGNSPHPTGMGAFVLGTVAENGNSEFPGMVKVVFTAWTDGENISKWLPVLSSYAGKEHGRYLIPEVGDIVLVGFIGPMQEQPFVLGSFYPADSSMPGEQSDKNNLNRCLKTKGGVMLTVRDGDGKQSVNIETPKGLKINLDDEGEAITVSDQGSKNCFTLDCKGGAAELLTDKSITLKTGSCEITMDGSGGALTIKGGQLTLEGSQSAELKSNATLTVSGGTATVEGKQTIALKGSAMCEISGGMVKIN